MVKVSQGGRIVIPKKMREKLKIRVGDELLMKFDGKRLIIQPKNMVEEPIKKLYGCIKMKVLKNPKKEAREWIKKRIEENL